MANQIIKHGIGLDFATPKEVAEIVSRVMEDKTSEDYTKRPGVVKLDGNGAGRATEDISPQFDWRMERITIGGAGAINAIVALFENDSTSDANLLEVIQLGAAGRYSDGFANNIYVPANSVVVITVTGGVIGQDVTYRLQIKQVRAVPGKP